MLGFPNKPMGFPTKHDQPLGWRLGVPPFKETPTFLGDPGKKLSSEGPATPNTKNIERNDHVCLSEEKSFKSL